MQHTADTSRRRPPSFRVLRANLREVLFMWYAEQPWSLVLLREDHPAGMPWFWGLSHADGSGSEGRIGPWRFYTNRNLPFLPLDTDPTPRWAKGNGGGAGDRSPHA